MIRIGLENPHVIYGIARKRRTEFEKIDLDARILADEIYFSPDTQEPLFSLHSIKESLDIKEHSTISFGKEYIFLKKVIDSIDASVHTDGYEYSLEGNIKTRPVFTKRDVSDLGEEFQFRNREINEYFVNGEIEKGRYDKGWYFQEVSMSMTPSKLFARQKTKNMFDENGFYVELSTLASLMQTQIHKIYDSLLVREPAIYEPDLDILLGIPKAFKSVDDPIKSAWFYGTAHDVNSVKMELIEKTPVYTFMESGGQYKPGDLMQFKG